MPDTEHHSGGNSGDNAVVPFTLDKKHQEIKRDQNPVSGAYLYGLGVPEGYDLMLKSRGQGDDTEIKREGQYEIKPGDQFYTAKSELTPGA